MAIIKVKNISELNLPKKEFNHGYRGIIYEYGKNILFKDLQGSGYIDILEILMELKNTKYLVLPKDIYVNDIDVIGYTMKRINGNTLDNTPLDTEVSLILNRFRLLLKDIYILSKNYLVNPDFSSDNILFDGNLYGIDFDSSIIHSSILENYHIMSFDIFTILLNYFTNYQYSFIKKDNRLNNIYNSLSDGKTLEYDYFWGYFFNKLEEIYNKEIITVRDLRRSLNGYYKS